MVCIHLAILAWAADAFTLTIFLQDESCQKRVSAIIPIYKDMMMTCCQ